MKTKRILAWLLTLTMFVTFLMPITTFAAVQQADRPSNPRTNLVIGILNDSRASDENAFPNEPAVTGYDYYYLQSTLSLSTNFLYANFVSNCTNYIDITAFWNDERINENAEGDAFGYYNPTGLNLATDPFFKDGFAEVINEETIIKNWLRAQNKDQNTWENYELLFYVLKYETGVSSGYHLDAKVKLKNTVILSYDANKPVGVTADPVMPSSKTVVPNSVETVAQPTTRTITANGITYEFTGWNTKSDGNGTDYAVNSDITVVEDTKLYAQWKIANTYMVTWKNHNGTTLLKRENIAYGTQVSPTDDYTGETPTRASDSHYSYTFKEWKLDESCTYDVAKGITEDLIYHAVFDAVELKFKATVEVVLNGVFGTDGNHDAGTGSHVNIETVVDGSDGNVYLKLADGTGDYITLAKDSDDFYSNENVSNGDYHIFIKKYGSYERVGTQEFTIVGADRTRALPYYSVEYFDGESASAIATEYYYIGSAVDVTDEIPLRTGYIFEKWADESVDPDAYYEASTSLKTVPLTGIITKAYQLTAQWIETVDVNVTVVVDQNGRTNATEDLTIHLTAKNSDTENYNEISGTTETFLADEWYDGNTTSGITTFEANLLYEDVSSEAEYGIHASIPGYRTDTDRPGGYIEIDKNGNVYNITYYLIYDPTGYELPFTVKIAEGTPDRMIPVAVDVKVTRYNGSEWVAIPQHNNESVEVVIDENGEGTGKVHVWGFYESNGETKPYLYRVDVVRIDLGDYQLTVTDTDNENYTSLASGFFPAGAYTAVVEVTGSDLEADGLEGAHANTNYEAHGAILATVSVHPYNIELDPNGGQWSESDSASKLIENRFTVPDLAGYVPTRDGYTFGGWYTEGSVKIETGTEIKNYVREVGGTLTLVADWKPDLTVKGTVIVDLGDYPCTDTNRTVIVALQMHKGDGTYDVTEFTKTVSLAPVQNNRYATGTYEFTKVPDIGVYRVAVIVAGGGTVTYQNEPDSKIEANLYDSTKYAADKYAAVFDGDAEAVVNVYMTADVFNLGYRANTAAIAEAFRPTDLKLDLRHDHRPAGGDVKYEVIKDDLAIDTFINGVSDIQTVEVPQRHANGYLYDYVISVLDYDIDAMGWDNRHYYHYDTTQGYIPAPFDIIYNGPANYSETPITDNGNVYNQDLVLTATFVPKTYNITYVMNNGSWADAANIGPARHTWGIDTTIPTPVRDGYMFMGWTAEVAETFDSEYEKIPANVWQNVTLTANWERDVWNDASELTDDGDGIPDKHQALLIFEIEGGTWDGTDANNKRAVVTLKTQDGDGNWQDAAPGNVSAYAPAGTYIPVAGFTTPGDWAQNINVAVPEGESVYTYRFTPETPTFIFAANGGSWENPVDGYTMLLSNAQASVTGAYNFEIGVIPVTPVRAGYNFAGWYAEPEGITQKWANAQDTTVYNVTEDTKVYAKWEWIPVNGTLNVVLKDEDGNVLQTENPIPIVDDYKISADNDSNYVIPASIVIGEDNYIYEAPTAESDALIGRVTAEGQIVNVILQYTKDNWNDSGDEDEGGDGIADKQQVKITYASNDTTYGTVDKSLDIITLSGSDPENINASANATTQGGRTYFVDWKIGGITVSTSTALAHTIENATGGSSYDFVANFGISTGGGGGGITTRYTLTYETNGGNNIPKETHNAGYTVKITKVPVKEGYVFEGWYEDKELTKSVDEVKMTKNITVYAKWVEDNGGAGSGYDTPGSLNGEDHFAYVVGYPDGTVRPNDNISRAEVTAIFFRLLKPDEVRDNNLTDENDFADVNIADWYNTAISTMAKLGIVNGRTAESFVPNAFITRAEFATICARFDDSEFEVVDNFTDVQGHWAEHDIHEAAAHGWIRGYEDGTFKPDQLITRAEAITMINRVLNRVPETVDDLISDMIQWPDNSDRAAWYYLAVQEATNSHDYEMKNHIYEKWTALREVTDWSKYE